MRKAIALLVTLFFIMLITISIGVGLKQVNEASSEVQAEKFLYQSKAIVDDVLGILQNSSELKDINSSQELSAFISQSSLIPFEAEDIKVSIEISSARSKFNVNSLVDESKKQNKLRVESLKSYVSYYMINPTYVEILLDSMGGIKDDMSYNSDLFNQKPDLFRDYISSYKHLKELNDFYTSYYHEDSLKNIDFKSLFSYSNDKEYKLDLSFATAEVLELVLGCDRQRAIDLSSDMYESEDDMDLSEEEKDILSRFDSSVFERFLEVRLNIMQDKHTANISFEYDIENKKGSNFVYEI